MLMLFAEIKPLTALAKYQIFFDVFNVFVT